MNTRDLKSLARRLRRDSTSAEQKLWRVINNRQIAGFRFRRQVVLLGYIVDFACYDARLVVEIDGATHSADTELARDASRDAALKGSGYDVLRFRNQEVYDNLDGVAETIRLKIAEIRPRYEDDGSFDAHTHHQ